MSGQLSEYIIKNIGGKENISQLTHCATRLRLYLKDEALVDFEELKKKKEILNVVKSGEQIQIIIGSHVSDVYKSIMEKIDDKAIEKQKVEKQRVKKQLFLNFINTVSDIFAPVLPAITAAGMLKAVLSLIAAMHLVDISSHTYMIISFAADTAFYFLPILLADSSAKKFKCNPYLAMMIGGILLHPTFVAMVAESRLNNEPIKFMMMPVYNANYASTVIPIILSVWLLSYVEKYAEKYSPDYIRYFSVPFFAVFITGTVSLVVLGPIGYIIGNFIAEIILFLEGKCYWLVPMLLGGCLPLLVMSGTHHGITPIGANNIMTLGYDTIVGPGNLASNIATGGAVFAVVLKSKNDKTKQLAASSGITALCGISEPALFGIGLKIKTVLYSSMAGGAFGGLFYGLFRVKRYSTGSPGLITLPVYIGENSLTNFYYACGGVVISFIVAFVLSYILFKENE